MLTLTRRVNETICIDHNIKITIKSLHGGQVKLSIDAPSNVAIHRKEIYDKIMSKDKNERNIYKADHLTDILSNLKESHP